MFFQVMMVCELLLLLILILLVGNVECQQKILPSDVTGGDMFGYSVSISGEYALIGEIGKDNGRGASYIYIKTSNGWVKMNKLLASDGVSNDQFGFSVSLSGEYAIIGANGKDNNRGAAYIYMNTTNDWIEVKRLLPNDGSSGDNFGNCVSISGEYALVAANGRDASRGMVYIYRNTSNDWIDVQKLSLSDGVRDDMFGSSASISNNYAIVGASNKDSYYGAAYIYMKTSNGWIKVKKLVASDADSYDQFGYSVSISGEYVIVGALSKNSHRGAAYVFMKTANDWIEVKKLLASDGVSNDYFGSSVSISGEYAIVGAPQKNSATGASYIYMNKSNDWIEVKKLLAGDGAAKDQFGSNIFIYGEYALVGSYRKDSLQGAVYTYQNCGIGYRMNGSNCSKCEGGTYAITEYAQQCLVCPAGSSCEGGSSIVECKAGSYCPVGSSKEIDCAVGHMCITTTSQQPCIDGMYCPSGTVAQTPCPAGYYCITPANISECDAGYYCDGGNIEPVECIGNGIYCPSGSIKNDQKCPSGYYCATTATETICPSGSYCESGSSSPIACDVGMYCEEGSSVQIPCPAGYYCNNTSTKILCEAGDYCPEKSTRANKCLSGSYCPSTYVQIVCEAGSYCIKSGLTYPLPCPAGHYCASADAKTICPSGSYCESGSSSPIACDVGMYCEEGSSIQIPCPAGYYCNNTSSKILCDIGSYCPIGSSESKACDVGKYCTVPSAPSADCPVNTYCPSGTYIPGLCPAGYYCESPDKKELCIAPEYCPEGSTTAQNCPAGYFCSTSDERSACVPGYYCPMNSKSATPCPAGQYCIAPDLAPKDCPVDHYCPKQSTAPLQCTTSCPSNAPVIISKCTSTKDLVCGTSNANNKIEKSINIPWMFVSVLSSIVILILVISKLLARKAPDTKPIRLFTFILSIGDFVSDILFIIHMYQLEITWAFYASISIMCGSMLFHGAILLRLLLGWLKDERFHQFVDDRLFWIALVFFISCGNPESMLILTSKLFHLQMCSAPLKRKDERSIEMLGGIGLIIETVPQLGIQVAVILTERELSDVVAFALFISVMQLLVAVVKYSLVMLLHMNTKEGINNNNNIDSNDIYDTSIDYVELQDNNTNNYDY